MNSATGGCLCGYVRYTYHGDIGEANYCHCEDCRRVTGSAFGVSVQLDVKGFEIVSGQTRSFTKHGDSGNELTRHFCPQCGSPVYTSSPAHPQHIYVKAGTLDDASLVAPARQSWTASSVSWHRIPPTITSYPKGRT